ncbi:phosphoenolpyruvate carboxykinase (ATP) [Thermoproteota archaeon]
MPNNSIPRELEALGIKTDKLIYRNPSYEQLFEHETDPSLKGFEKGILTELDAVNVDTGRFTGRSPKDKYIVRQSDSEKEIWWRKDGSDNQPMSEKTWAHIKDISIKELTGKPVYVMDGYCGANPNSRLCVRLITEIAWQAHFFKNMFLRPTKEELAHFEPDWTIFSASKTVCKDYEKYNMHSEVFAAFNIGERMMLLGGSWYGGEIKKGIFSIMNYFLPLRGIGSFHCSANMGRIGDTALFFGLSGTGKTTLSADPKRALIGDDEHGWDDEGIFNLEGGCYAKVINLSEEKEPDIYNALRRNALLENVVIGKNGLIDFSSDKKTENTRASYPIDHIDNIVKPVSKGGHPSTIIFLTCDAYGVLPPVSRLSRDQAMYQYLSGYTAKVAGTELGITEPVATFSSCFGQPFLLLHPTRYAEILGSKMDKHGTKAYLINTGWTGGSHGTGRRISLSDTRAIVDAVLNHDLENVEYEMLPVFNLQIPKHVPGVSSEILNPGNTWKDKTAYDKTLMKLAKSFITNFKIFTNTPEGKRLESQFGPRIIDN